MSYINHIKYHIFTNEFNKLLFTNIRSYKRIIITGDFNINMLTNNQICIDYNNVLLSYNLITYINNITRPSSKTLLDNFFTNMNKSKLINSYIIYDDISDHLTILLSLISPNRLTSYKPSNNIFSYNRVLSLDNLKLFINNIKNSDLFSVYYDNVNDNFNISIRTLLPLFKNSLTNNMNNPFVNYNTKWMTFEILNSINTKARLYKNYLKNPTLLNNKKYTIHTKILEKVIRLAKQNYFNSKIKEYNSNQNKLWKSLNSLTNNSKVENNQYNITQIKITNKYKLADIFNNRFSNLDLNIINNNNNKDPSKNNINNPRFIPSNIPILDNLDNYFNFNNVEINDILFSLKKINKSHSNDIYGLNYDCFKTIILYNTQYFVDLINMSFKEGVFPEILKNSKIIPILKNKSNKQDSTNYRPITITPVFSKIIEKLAHNRIYNF